MIRENRNRFSTSVREAIDMLEDSALQEIENFILAHKPEFAVQRCGYLSYNQNESRAYAHGEPLYLTKKESVMLALMFLRRGHVITKEMFLNHLYGGMDEPEPKIIDIFICKLRKKIAQATGGPSYIETVWGIGYLLPAANVEQDTP